MAAYERAAAGDPVEIAAARTAPGTINALVVSYYKTGDFKGLRPITQQTYRNILERFREAHGDKRVATLERRHIQKMMGERSATPMRQTASCPCFAF